MARNGIGGTLKPEEVQEFIKNHVIWWVNILGLGTWGFQFRQEDGKPKSDDGDSIVAVTDASWKYMTATITFYPECFQDMTDDEAEYSIVHELMHVLLDEMDCRDIAHEERVATMLARAFLRVKEADR